MVIMALRPVQVMEMPVVFPHVCLNCGSPSGRDYFVDIGCDMDHTNFQPLWDGAIYFCNVCMEAIISDYHRALARFMEDKNSGIGIATDSREDDVDAGNSGNVDDVPESPDGTSEEPNGSVPQSEPPIAATLDSTGFGILSF